MRSCKCHLSRVLRQSQLSTTNINTKCHLDRVLRVVSRSTTCEWYPHQQLAGGIWTRGIPINNLRMVCGWHPKDTRMLNWVSRSTTCDPKLKSWHRDSNRRPPLKSDWRYCIHNSSQISMDTHCTLIDSAQFCRAELQVPHSDSCLIEYRPHAGYQLVAKLASSRGTIDYW